MRPFYGFMFHGQTISDALKFDQGSDKKYNFGERVVGKYLLDLLWTFRLRQGLTESVIV